jgi:hypothetical protein
MTGVLIMISGYNQGKAQDYAKYMQNPRTQLAQQSNVNRVPNAQSAISKTTEPAHKIQIVQQPEESNIDYAALIADVESKRDSARQAAVHVQGLVHQQNMIDTYIAVSSDENDQSHSASVMISPADVYQESMGYSRNRGLIGVYESVSNEKPDRVHISTLA